MRLWLIALLPALISFSSAQAQAPDIENDFQNRYRLAGELRARSGDAITLAQWKEDFLSRDPTNDCICELTEKQWQNARTLWQQAVEIHFDPVAIETEIQTAVAKKVNVDDLEQALDFANTSLGQKVTAANRDDTELRDGASLEAQQAREAARVDEAINALEADPERAAIIQHLIDSTDALDMQIEVIASISRASLSAAEGLAQKHQCRPHEHDIEATLELHRYNAQRYFAPLLPGAYHRLYATTSTAELAEFVDWLKSPSGRRLTKAHDQALIHQLHTAANKIGTTFAASLAATIIEKDATRHPPP